MNKQSVILCIVLTLALLFGCRGKKETAWLDEIPEVAMQEIVRAGIRCLYPESYSVVYNTAGSLLTMDEAAQNSTNTSPTGLLEYRFVDPDAYVSTSGRQLSELGKEEQQTFVEELNDEAFGAVDGLDFQVQEYPNNFYSFDYYFAEEGIYICHAPVYQNEIGILIISGMGTTTDYTTLFKATVAAFLSQENPVAEELAEGNPEWRPSVFTTTELSEADATKAFYEAEGLVWTADFFATGYEMASMSGNNTYDQFRAAVRTGTPNGAVTLYQPVGADLQALKGAEHWQQPEETEALATKMIRAFDFPNALIFLRYDENGVLDYLEVVILQQSSNGSYFELCVLYTTDPDVANIMQCELGDDWYCTTYYR